MSYRIELQNNALIRSYDSNKEEQKQEKEKEEVRKLRHRLTKLLREKEMDIYSEMGCSTERTKISGIFANLQGKCNAKNIAKHIKILMLKKHEPQSLKVFFRKWMLNVPKLRKKYKAKTKIMRKDSNIIITNVVYIYSAKNKEDQIFNNRVINKNRLYHYSNKNEIKKIAKQDKKCASENKEKRGNLKLYTSVHNNQNRNSQYSTKIQKHEYTFRNNYRTNNTFNNYNKYDYDTFSNSTNNDREKKTSFRNVNIKSNNDSEINTNKNNLNLDNEGRSLLDSYEYKGGNVSDVEINKLQDFFKDKIKRSTWTIHRETYESKEIF